MQHGGPKCSTAVQNAAGRVLDAAGRVLNAAGSFKIDIIWVVVCADAAKSVLLGQNVWE